MKLSGIVFNISERDLSSLRLDIGFYNNSGSLRRQNAWITTRSGNKMIIVTIILHLLILYAFREMIIVIKEGVV